MNRLAAELQAKAWAMEPRALSALVARVSGVEPSAQLELSAGPETDRPQLQVDGNAATIPIHGVIMAEVPWFFSFFGIAATSTRETRALLAEAMGDDQIESVTLDIDSPGGSIDGLAELAADVAAASRTKSVTAKARDTMASAAYWIGSQADSIEVGPTTAVGSIGVYAVVDDTSAAHEQAGIKTHVISSHPLKGAGVDGSEVTDEQLDDFQRRIDSLASIFVEAVAKGRGMKLADARALATGQIWTGKEAVANGLADSVRKPATPRKTRGTAAKPAATTAHTAAAAAKEPTMDEQIQDLQTQLEAANAATAEANSRAEAAESALVEAEAKAEASAVALVEVNKQRRADLIAANRDRITPAMIDHVDAYADACGDDLDKVSAFIATLPVQTRTEEQGASSEQTDEGAAEADPKAVAAEAQKYQDEQAKAGNVIRISDAVAHVQQQ